MAWKNWKEDLLDKLDNKARVRAARGLLPRGTSSDPMYLSHTLNPTPDLPFYYLAYPDHPIIN